MLLHSHRASRKNLLNLGKLPFFVAQRACTACLEPSLNTIQVEDMPTVPPSNTKSWMICISCRVCLIFNARLVQVVSANCTCICADSPGPHSHSVPLFDFKALSKLILSLHLHTRRCGHLSRENSNLAITSYRFLASVFLDFDIHSLCLVCHDSNSQAKQKPMQAGRRSTICYVANPQAHSGCANVGTVKEKVIHVETLVTKLAA